MYFLKSENSFDAAHFLAGYDGKCRNLHGHRWRVILEIKSETLEMEGQTRGMCVDFSTIKTALKEETDYFDHALIIEEGSLRPKTMEALREEEFNIRVVDFRPTAENFSRYFFEQFEKRGFQVHRVTVYETPNNCAAYEA